MLFTFYQISKLGEKDLITAQDHIATRVESIFETGSLHTCVCVYVCLFEFECLGLKKFSPTNQNQF